MQDLYKKADELGTSSFSRQIAKILTHPIGVYRKFISPLLSPSCRHFPSCSEYAEEAINEHGPFRGILLAAKRILRCNPLFAGGYDPVPKK
jgi:putative membrane protein insertion efficiency factor